MHVACHLCITMNNTRKPEEIKEHLRELLVLKQSGQLDTDEKLLNLKNESLWRDCVSYDCLESYVQHHDEEIKLNTLALLTESKKSTLKFTSKELDIIILFLNVNFKEKLEFVPLIKKALRRMKESLVVMRRQSAQEEKMRRHYEKNCNPAEMDQEVLDQSFRISHNLQMDIDAYCNTFQSLRNICICTPDATYYRRKSSLQILLLMKDLLDNEFKHIAWKTEQAKALFNLLLLDTYESNKEIAFNLIKSMNPSLLRLDEDSNVCDIITVAIRLGNSIRPIDTITAAYMLRIAMLSPIIQTVLRKQYNMVNHCENISEATILQLVLILLEKLKESLTLARENIVKTVTKHSVYGYFFCIRSLLQECNLRNAGKEELWKNTVAELVSVCFEFSHSVSLIVNNSSPEGHLPMDLNLQTIAEICGSSSEKEVVTPQMVLLCSWRTVKEVSLLFGLLTTKAPIREENSPIELLKDDQVIRIGEHLVTLLTETKHRGAFEQAHVGFSQLCTRLWRLKNKNLNKLPRMWLHQILIAIAGVKGENSKLCATRRSAGVPFMIQALLSTEPRQHKDTKTTTFHSVMKILLGFTQLENLNALDRIKQLMYTNTVFSGHEDSFESIKTNRKQSVENNDQASEIKTHALNILRAIFRHSQLAEVVNDYVTDGLIAAFKSYDALTWAERNAATLLFSALIIRIFGVQRTKDHINLTTDNKMNYKVFFEKYPNLLPFILDELQTFVLMDDTIVKSNIQSILLLLSRLYHSHSLESTNIEQESNNLITLIMHCAKSAVYETRKLAARALVPLLNEQSVGDVLSKIIENVIDAENNHPSINLIHGYMLQIFEIVRNFSFKHLQSFGVNWNRFFKRTSWILECLERGNSDHPCFLLATVYVKIFNEIVVADKMYLKQQSTLLHTLVSHIAKHENLKQGPARGMYEITLINFMRTVVRENSLIQESVLLEIYLHSLTNSNTQIITWSAIGEIIIANKLSEASALMINSALNVIYNTIQDIHGYSPELQDALFNFLYHCINHSSIYIKKMDICKFVLNKLRLHDKKDYYCERDSYLRLLGKSYVALTCVSNDQEVVSQECTDDVYNSFCDHLWITTLNGDFKQSVLQILEDLFITYYKHGEYHYAQLQWWTTILQLLLDNIPQTRREASVLVDCIPIQCSLPNNYCYLHPFLMKFYKFMLNKEPEFACVVLFYWSISLLDDTDYEMDETDVFNKCTNYDFYEPVELSKLCAEIVEECLRNFIDKPLANNAINWINSNLDIQLEKSISFRTLVGNYEDHVPTIEDKLRDILNPTYKSKLLQILAYRQYKEIL